MTAIKQRGVTSTSHGKNLRRYIDHKDALLRDSQNLINPDKWYSEMESTREDFGHDRSRANSKNTIIFHQMLNFLPDECDINGGHLSPELCMKYAKEYTQTYYPEYQIAFALHREHCKTDNTFRYSVHMAINRTNLTTGNRLAEGRGDAAKKKRAGQVRALDEKWDLAQLKKGVRNSFVHEKQPSRVEREILSRNEYSYKQNLRELILAAKDGISDFDTWCHKLNDWGIDVSLVDGKVYLTDVDENKYSFRADRLKHDFLGDISLPETDDHEHDSNPDYSANEIESLRLEYLHKIEDRFQKYVRTATSLKGTDYKDFPKFSLPKRSDIHNTFELNLITISLKQKADDIRVKYSSHAPFKKNSSRSSSGHKLQDDNSTQTKAQSHEKNNSDRSR